MLGEFTRRLLVALPLVCLFAVLAILLLRRSRLAGGGAAGLSAILGGRLPFAPAAAEAPALRLLGVRPITPAARLAVVRFDGRDLLIGVSGQSFTLLATGAPHSPAEVRSLAEAKAFAENRAFAEGRSSAAARSSSGEHP